MRALVEQPAHSQGPGSIRRAAHAPCWHERRAHARGDRARATLPRMRARTRTCHRAAPCMPLRRTSSSARPSPRPWREALNAPQNSSRLCALHGAPLAAAGSSDCARRRAGELRALLNWFAVALTKFSVFSRRACTPAPAVHTGRHLAARTRCKRCSHKPAVCTGTAGRAGSARFQNPFKTDWVLATDLAQLHAPNLRPPASGPSHPCRCSAAHPPQLKRSSRSSRMLAPCTCSRRQRRAAQCCAATRAAWRGTPEPTQS